MQNTIYLNFISTTVEAKECIALSTTKIIYIIVTQFRLYLSKSHFKVENKMPFYVNAPLVVGSSRLLNMNIA